MCNTHYLRWWRANILAIECSIDGCERSVRARGWCQTHYWRWYRYGDPLAVRQIVRDDKQRLLSHVRVGDPGECWPWTGRIDKYGYGHTQASGETLAHRAVYIAFVGEIPDGQTIDHTCHRHDECDGGVSCPHRRCCNWNHHEPVPMGVNVLRGNSPTAVNARMVMCAKGLHLFDAANTYVDPSGRRRCRACNRRWRQDRRTLGLSA